MKNTFKVLGIIGLMLVIGFSMAACGGDDDGGSSGGGGGGGNSLAGTRWDNTYSTIRFNNSSYGYYTGSDSNPTSIGTYTFDGRSGSMRQSNTNGSANFTVNGSTLTVVSSSANSIVSGTYTKRQ